MDLDGYIVIFTRDQKERFDKFVEENPSSFAVRIHAYLEKNEADETWTADISKRNYCLVIIELKRKGETELVRRLVEVGKIQDSKFYFTLDSMEREYGMYSALFN